MKMLVALGVVAAFVVVAIGSYISVANYGNRAEKEIIYVWENNENILSQYVQKVQEAAQVPSMQRDDLKQVVTEVMAGRYGKDGSKAVFQWIKEQNPQLDSRVYVKLQQIVEAGRDEFKTAQTSLIDAKRSYDTNLGYIWKGFWLSMAGYPKIDLSKYKAISNDYASDAFKTGKEKGPVQLRPESR